MSKIIPDRVSGALTRPAFFIGLEGPRMMLESLATPLSLAWLGRLRSGEGEPVLLVPPFAPAMSTMELRLALRYLGHRVHCPPELTTITRTPMGTRRVVIDLTKKLSDTYGEPINLVGWCYGGSFTRMAALAEPERVRQVINLGTALGGRQFRGEGKTAGTDPLPVPSTVIYSRSDGLFDHHEVREPEGRPRSENIEIPSSHFGMGNHPMALYVIADRLAQPKDQWRPFGWSSLAPTFAGATQPARKASSA